VEFAVVGRIRKRWVQERVNSETGRIVRFCLRSPSEESDLALVLFVVFVGLLGCSEFVCCFWWFSIGSGCGRVKKVGLLCWSWEVRACVVENATERGSLCPRKESS
jgi:hypothetical protein